VVPSPPGSDASRPAPAAEERRPTSLLLVYVWDMVLAVLALFGALAAFGGGVEEHGRTVTLSLPVQLLQAFSSGALAASLIVIGSLLTRQQAWVRRAQIVLLAMTAGLGLTSLLADEVTAGEGLQLGPLLGSVLFALLDVAAIVVMTGPRLTAWHRKHGPVPLYLGGLVAFWAATSVALAGLRLAA
jgi:hypothetical protein